MNGFWNYDAELLNKFGGFVQGQYYFTNQWYFNAIYAISKTFNVSRVEAQWAGFGGLGGREMAFTGDNPSTIQQVDLTLWYRPIQAIKFGLQYSYAAAATYKCAPLLQTPLIPAGLGTCTGWSLSGTSTSNLIIG